MAADPMHVTLTRVGKAAFEAEAGSGGKLVVDGSPAIGGEGKGMRPMELLLSALASCAAMDVVNILTKQKEPLEDLTIRIEGTRKDGTPSPFTKAVMVFEASGAVDPHKLNRAVGLAVEKYCSVGATLAKDVDVTWEARLRASP